ncbi:Uu.00g018740.m01.CDS01 [Anthostomella pinea]|uniref:Uu.00g018740.m01.CDS01 n=1 Tax=Anthostomella pinea TaxID=933095 RepID=A0AAI8W020_9PEZI|nr:Uu.00g018740.m01.CDS01 [Anthostomella pinea]
MPHSVRNAHKATKSGTQRREENVAVQTPAEYDRAATGQTMLNRWATTTSHKELSISEVLQQPQQPKGRSSTKK